MSKDIVKANVIETVAIHKHLTEVIESTEGGFVTFKPGCNDKTIAKAVSEECGRKLSPNSVARIRLDVFGRLRQQAGGSANVAAKVAALEEMLNTLYEETVPALEAKAEKAERDLHQIREAIKLASNGAKITFNEKGDPVRAVSAQH